MNNILLLIISILIFSSCSIQKRHYLNGYNVDWGKKISNITEENIYASTVTDIVYKEENTDFESKIDIFTSNRKEINNQETTYKDSIKCDEILLNNGDEIKVKVLEISPIEIKYKKCDNLEGPQIIIKKSDVFLIKYSNGTKEIINKEGNKKS